MHLETGSCALARLAPIEGTVTPERLQLQNACLYLSQISSLVDARAAFMASVRTDLTPRLELGLVNARHYNLRAHV